MNPEEERAKAFARRLFGVESLGAVNMNDNAEWRRFLDAIDFATRTADGYTVVEVDGEIIVKPA